MEAINLDLNNLFNLSYNFEGLKIFLASIAKNQDLMMGKIRDLEKKYKDNKNKLDSISGEIEIKNDISKNISILSKNNNIIQNLNQSNDIKYNENNKNNEKIINEYDNKQENSFDSKYNNKDNNILLFELENRIYNLEKEYKDLKSFIPVYEKSYTLNDILDEHKVNINDMKENINEINNNIGNMKENMEKINLKLGDFSIYDLFKDNNVSGDIDAAKLLVKTLEKKVFDKFKFDEDKIKKDEEDLLKLKNDLTNLKNSSSFETRNLSYLKEQILKVPKDIEVIRASLSERIIKNKEYIDKLKEKSNNSIKEINININTIKKEVKNLESKINNKLDELEKNIKKESKEEIISPDLKNEDIQTFKEMILKKCINLEKKYNSLNSNIKPEELDEKIKILQNELQNKKPNQQDFYNLNELVQGNTDDLENIKNDKSNMEDSLRKMKDTIYLINKKCEDLILHNIKTNKNNEDPEETKSKQNLFLAKLDDYVETSIFNEFIKEETKLNEKFKKDIESYKQFNDEIIETLKKSASIQDLKNLEDYLVDLFNEFKDKIFKLCPKQSDVNKNFRTLELQIKNIYEMIIKKDERTENWMLAKKPIGGFSCASCEKYLGDLKENDEKVYWNQLPDHEKNINVNRIGNGFSRILNLVNVKKENKNENNENYDNLLKSDIEKPDYGQILNKDDKNNENNKNTENEKKKFNSTVYNLNKRKKNVYRNVNIEYNINTVPNLNNQEENDKGYNTQRLRLTADEKGNIFKEIKDKKSENNPKLPLIIYRNDEHTDIFEEGKDQKNCPKLLKIVKKKK